MYIQLFVKYKEDGNYSQYSCDNLTEVQSELTRLNNPPFIKCDYYNENGLVGTAHKFYDPALGVYVLYKKIAHQTQIDGYYEPLDSPQITVFELEKADPRKLQSGDLIYNGMHFVQIAAPCKVKVKTQIGQQSAEVAQDGFLVNHFNTGTNTASDDPYKVSFDFITNWYVATVSRLGQKPQPIDGLSMIEDKPEQ